MILTLTDDNQFLRIDDATELELEQITISLTKRIESWRFNPLVKRGVWDGYVSYIKDDKWIPAGLWRYVIQICKDYKIEILGDCPRIAIEAGCDMGWAKYIGDKGAFIGMKGFGASGPASELYKHFGITTEAVVEKVKSILN